MNEQDAKKFIRRLDLYFNLIVALPLLVFGYLYLEIESGRMDPYLARQKAQLIEYIFPFLIILTGGIGLIIPNEKLKRLNTSLGLSERTRAYEKIQILRYGIYEMGEWFAIIALYLTGNKLYGLFYVLVLVLFSFDRPTIHRISKQLKLSNEEKKIFEK